MIHICRTPEKPKIILTIGSMGKVERKKRIIIKMSLRNGKVINHRRRIPVGIKVVVSSLEWHRMCPDLVQDSRQILRIGSHSGFIFGNGDVSHLQLLPQSFLRMP